MITSDLSELLNTKVVDDCFDFLHIVEIGKGTMENLVKIFGRSGNLYESNYRQVEIIKTRCIKAGIYIRFDDFKGKFETEANAKLKFMVVVDKIIEDKRGEKPTKSFGVFHAAKVDNSFID